MLSRMQVRHKMSNPDPTFRNHGWALPYRRYASDGVPHSEALRREGRGARLHLPLLAGRQERERYRRHLERTAARQTRNLRRTFLSAINSLVRLLEAADENLREEIVAALRGYGDDVLGSLLPALRSG